MRISQLPERTTPLEEDLLGIANALEEANYKLPLSRIALRDDDGLVREVISRTRRFDTLGDAKGASDLVAGQIIVVTDPRRGGVLVVKATGTYTVNDEGNVFAGNGVQLVRLEYITDPHIQDIRRFNSYEGDLSALDTATRIQRQQANFWSIQNAIHAAITWNNTPNSVPCILNIEGHYQYRIPDSADDPFVRIPDDANIIIQNGTLECTNFNNGFNPFDGLHIGVRPNVIIRNVDLVGPKYHLDYETFAFNGAPDGTTVTPINHILDPEAAEGRDIRIMYNRTSQQHNDGNAIVRTIASVAVDGSSLELTTALPSDFDTGKAHTGGIDIDPDYYAERLDLYGEDWFGGTDSNGVYCRNGTETVGQIIFDNVNISGKFGNGVWAGHGELKIIIKGGKWTSHSEVLNVYSHSNPYKPTIIAEDWEVYDAGYKPRTFMGTYRSTRIGHSWYVHPNVNIRFTRVLSRDSNGTLGKLYSSSAITAAPDFVEYYGCVFKNAGEGEGIILNGQGRAVAYNCQFFNTNISCGIELELHNPHIENGTLLSLSSGASSLSKTATRSVRVYGGHLELSGTISLLQIDGIYTLEIHYPSHLSIDLNNGNGGNHITDVNGGTTHSKLTIYGAKNIHFYNLPANCQFVNSSKCSIDIRDCEFLDSPTTWWIQSDGRTTGITYRFENVVAPRDQYLIRAQGGTGYPEPSSVTLINTPVRLHPNYFGNPQNIEPPKDKFATVSVAAQSTFKPEWIEGDSFNITGTATIVDIHDMFAENMMMRFKLNGATLSDTGNIDPKEPGVALNRWVTLIHNSITAKWEEV